MERFLSTAKEVALEAGAIMLTHFSAGAAHVLKADRTPLTKADTLVNELVLRRLGDAFPEHSLLGEEGSVMKDSEYLWVFDPIDGTSLYLRGIPVNVFSLALVRDGLPILGVVYDPYLRRLFHAVHGKGAYVNDVPIRTSRQRTLSRSAIAIDGFRGFEDLAFLEELRAQHCRFYSFGSTVYAHMLVATGQLDGVVFPLVRPTWDSAAAKILIEEAGGVTSDLFGNSQRFDAPIQGFVSAGTQAFHRELLACIEQSLPDAS